MPYYLGLDIGGSKSHALVTDRTGRALGFAHGPGGNPESVGYDGLAHAAGQAAAEALARAGLSAAQLRGAAAGISGYDWPSQRADTLRALRPLGLPPTLEVVNDAIIGLVAGAPHGWGVGLVAGTGCNCRGRNEAGREARVVGMSRWTGEAAGADHLVRQATRAITHAWTRRGPPTALSAAFMAFAGAHDLDDFIEGMATGRYPLDHTAAPLVFRVAADGDLVAQAVVRWAGEELAGLAVGVIRQLALEHTGFDLVLIGSLWNGSPLLQTTTEQAIWAVAPGARFVRLAAPPVIGAVLLAMQPTGEPAVSVRARLVETTNHLIREIAAGAHARPVAPSSPAGG
jgi:N-acetylglucosamine kinase-like BadF-type ATPase